MTMDKDMDKGDKPDYQFLIFYVRSFTTLMLWAGGVSNTTLKHKVVFVISMDKILMA